MAIDPATAFARMDQQLAQFQGEMTALAADAQRILAEQQIGRLLADHRNWLAEVESKLPNHP